MIWQGNWESQPNLPPPTASQIKAQREATAREERYKRYEAALGQIAGHDWQEIGAKGHSYTLDAVAEFIDIAKAALGRYER